MKPTKKQRQLIARRARKLPEMEHTNRTIRVGISGAELLSRNPEMKDQDGKPIDPKIRYSVPVPRKVNHFDEMCAAFDREGMDGVEKYEQFIHDAAKADNQELIAKAKQAANERLAQAQEAAEPQVTAEDEATFQERVKRRAEFLEGIAHENGFANWSEVRASERYEELLEVAVNRTEQAAGRTLEEALKGGDE